MDNESIDAAAREIVTRCRGPHSLDFKVSERMELETEVAAVIRRYNRPNSLESILLFVCDCEAATAYDYAKKSALKCERRRHVNICKDVARMLESGEFFGHIRSNKESVIKRLRDAVTLLEEFNGHIG